MLTRRTFLASASASCLAGPALAQSYPTQTIRIIDTVCVASYDHTKQGDLQVLKGISADTAKLGGGTGKGLLIVDDLVDTGKTGRLVRDMMPDAHFATVYAKPKGRPLVDTFITEVSQDTWIFFPWDTALSFQPPIRDGAA